MPAETSFNEFRLDFERERINFGVRYGNTRELTKVLVHFHCNLILFGTKTNRGKHFQCNSISTSEFNVGMFAFCFSIGTAIAHSLCLHCASLLSTQHFCFEN